MTDSTTGGYDFGGSPFTGGYDGGCDGCNTEGDVSGGSMVTSFLAGNLFDGIAEAAIIAYFILLSMSLWIWGSEKLSSGMWAIAGIAICGVYFVKEYMNGQLYLARLFPMMGMMGAPVGVAPMGIRTM